MKAVIPAQAALLKPLQARRQQIVRELARIDREIVEAQQQLARLDAPAVSRRAA